MKSVLFLLILFSTVSCNNNDAEDITQTADSPGFVSPDSAAISQPPLTAELKFSNDLQSFTKEKIDSLDAQDILEKIKDILDILNELSENDDWGKAAEYYEKTESTMKQSQKGTDVFAKHQLEFNEIKTKIDNLHIEITKSEKYLKEISSESRWEKIRESFKEKIYSGEFTEFSKDQQDEYKKILENWEEFKETNKLSWFRKNESDLEELFFNYSKNKSKVKAAWGFIIQQVDWDGAVNYYTQIAPDAKATGKPYYTLKYYYNSIGKGSEFDKLYDNPTNEGVGFFCPHP